MKCRQSLKILLLVHLTCLLQQKVSAQNSQLVDGKLLGPKELVEDYDILFSSLTNYHPSPFVFIKEESLEEYYLKQRAFLQDSLSEREFYIIAKKLITMLKCGHTAGNISNGWFNALSGNAVILPFEIYREDSKVFIGNTVDEPFDFKVGDELISINDLPIYSILEQLDSIQPRDGNTPHFASEALVLNFRMYYLLFYGYQSNFKIEYRSGDSNKVTEVQSIPKRINKSSEISLPDNLNLIHSNSWSQFAVDTVKDIAYLQIQSFSDRKEYKEYYKLVFEELRKYPETKLIIDLRNNTGGYFGNGNRLLSHLTSTKFQFNFRRPKKDYEKNRYAKLNGWGKLTKLAFSLKPKKHRSEEYKVYTFSYRPQAPNYIKKVHVITNAFTLSQASVAAANLNESGAIFYGTETGGLETSNNAMLFYKVVLPNSKFKAKIPYYQVISNSTEGLYGRGIMPDYEITPIFNDHNDNVLLKVIELVTNK